MLAISDYGKGFLTPSLLHALISYARRHDIFVIVDPKGTDFEKYKGANLIKPNFKEAVEASRLTVDHPLKDIAQVILEKGSFDQLIITRSDKGMTVFDKQLAAKTFPVTVKEVKDVTGAGDTVLATLSAALAGGLTLDEACTLSNVAAGVSIEHLGCYRVTLKDISRRLLQINVKNKIFEESHLFALKKALEGSHTTLLCCHIKEALEPPFFGEILKFSKDPTKDLILYLDGAQEEEERLSLLASFEGVQYIILKKENLATLLNHISFDRVID